MKKEYYHDPIPSLLNGTHKFAPKFEAIWQVIKSWDINVPEAYGGYCGATGNHVMAILNGWLDTMIETGKYHPEQWMKYVPQEEYATYFQLERKFTDAAVNEFNTHQCQFTYLCMRLRRAEFLEMWVESIDPVDKLDSSLLLNSLETPTPDVENAVEKDWEHIISTFVIQKATENFMFDLVNEEDVIRFCEELESGLVFEFMTSCKVLKYCAVLYDDHPDGYAIYLHTTPCQTETYTELKFILTSSGIYFDTYDKTNTRTPEDDTSSFTDAMSIIKE